MPKNDTSVIYNTIYKYIKCELFPCEVNGICVNGNWMCPAINDPEEENKQANGDKNRPLWHTKKQEEWKKLMNT